MLGGEYFNWTWPGRRKPTSWKMTREDALRHHPQAEPVLHSREVRDCGSAPGKLQAGHVLDGPGQGVNADPA